MATTTNYGWEIPDDTDLVKDGAASIRELGQDIDTTVFGLPSGGLTLISATTIGTAVSSVTVSGAFSATYDNYKIVVSGGVASGNCDLGLKLGATATGYYAGRLLVNNQTSSTSFQGQGNTASWSAAGGGTTDTLSFNADLLMPFLTKRTVISAAYVFPNTNSVIGTFVGHLQNATSYTAFTILPNTGTITGGTIKVYGYK
jgi:hypothetical protein